MLFKYATIAIIFIFSFLRSSSQTIPAWQLADLEKVIDTSTQPTIINFWATFCKPCIAELPYFQSMADHYRSAGVQLIMVSLDMKKDYPEKIMTFARQLRLTSPISFLTETNADLFCPAVDSSWSGAIPASLFINKKTGYRRFIEDELSKEALEHTVKEMLAPASK